MFDTNWNDVAHEALTHESLTDDALVSALQIYLGFEVVDTIIDNYPGRPGRMSLSALQAKIFTILPNQMDGGNILIYDQTTCVEVCAQWRGYINPHFQCSWWGNPHV